MTDSRTDHSPKSGSSAGAVTTATVTGFNGAVIATVSRSLEHADGRTPLAVVSVHGDVDRDTAPLVERTLLRAIDEHPVTWLDVRQVGFFGAAGVHVLVRAHQRAAALGRTFELRGVHGITEQVLTIAGLDHMIAAIR
ncbi:STAS domain-containing protein [Catenuloplanes indicus]|uniref:Anti-anti-sigma factor n=1 Tax=Catenuloplanes indicus TaxID=137267 RepID=A0AAE4AXB3_9ACTN|nr:STAS domain-containing protein [Catenuloplanes indicus]MDQ0366825.1 anti-anti-sigma factor [Catenuloplanes indicus]